MSFKRWLIGILTGVTVGLLGSGTACAEEPDDLLIIANKSVPASSASAAELKRIFLMKQTSWSGRTKAVPINAKEGSVARTLFREKILGMTRAQEAKYWQDEKIKRGAKPPAEFGNPLKAVFMVKGSVSYMLRKLYKPNLVKILATF